MKMLCLCAVLDAYLQACLFLVEDDGDDIDDDDLRTLVEAHYHLFP
jgi:hypothetical protein